MDAAGHRGVLVVERQRLDGADRLQVLKGEVQRDITPGDRGGAGAAVGLDDVAVDADLALAESGEVGDRAQRATDQSLNFLSASALLAARRLAIGARAGRAGKHAVPGGDPAGARFAKQRN